MSQSTRTFQYEDDKSSKFWEVTQTDTTVVVRFGKTGTQGQSQEKSFADAAAAAKHAAKLIGEKTAKGYLERGAHSPGSAPSGNAASEPETQPAPATKAAQPSKTAKPTKPKNPAQDPDATHESLLALLDKDELTNRLLAKHPKASAELLEKLSHSSDKVTRQAVALNPSADKEVLARLAPQFPGDFFKNPAFDWLLLEDPDLLLRMGRGVMKNILKRPDCPPSFMKWALEHGSQPEQMAVAMNPAAPADIVAALARRKGGAGDSARGRAEVGAKKAQAAAEAVDPDAVFRAEVRKALGAVEPDEVVSAWKRDMVAGVHWPWLSLDCRLKVKDIPLAVVVAGCLKGREHELGDFPHPEVRALVGLFVEGDYALLTRLAADPSPKVRAAVAANLHCPAASFESLCQDKNPTVRAHAARNVQLTKDKASVLAADESPTVRKAVIAAWCIPEASLQALSLERSLDIKKSALARLAELAKPAANPDTSPEQLVVIASSAKGTAKVALAANPATPEHLIRAFAAEAHEATDKALLKNPRLPADVSQVVYARVFESMGPMQRLALLEHERTPWSIRKLAAQNAWLARWPRTQDWHRDAFNFVFAPDADADPHDVLHIPNGMEATYAASTLRSARLLGLAHPRTPLELLIKRSNSVDWVERLAIARNTSLPPNLVSKLKKDPHRLVAAQALATEAAKGTIKANQEQLLAETLAPVDWGKVVEALLREIRDKHVRPWEWFQTLWWPHLNLEFRMGLKAGPLYEKQTPYWLDQDLEEFFLDSPFSRERLAGAKWALLTAWLRKSALDLDPSGATRISEPLAPMERDESIMILEWAKDKDPNLRLRAIAHPQVSMDVLHLLATDKNQDVRLLAEVATLGRGDQVIPNRPARVSEIAGKVLAASDRCKEAVSGLPSSPAEILEALASHKPSDDVVGALARNPGAPASVLISVIRTAHARGATWKMTEALKNPSVSPAVIETLLKSKAAGIRAAIAMAEKVPLVIVRDLEKDADPEVRAALASRKDLPLDLQTVLSSDPDPKVRIALLRSGELPIALRESLARDLDPIVRSHALEPGGFAPSFYTELVGAGERCLSPNCIAEIEDEATLMTLAMSGEEFVDRSLYGGVTRTSAQGAILSRRQVPPSVLEALAMTPSHRRQIAGRNDVPSTLLSEFLEDPDERVVTAALENPRVEEGQMRRALAQRQSEARGRSVVHNPNSPHDLIEAAFKEFGGSKLGVNYWVENVSWLALKLSGASRHHQTQGFLRQERDRALSAKASPEELRRLCATGFWVIRKAVAANAVLPPEERASILRQLWAEVEAALFGDAPEAINSDQVSEEEVVAALQRLDLMPPAGDKRAIAAAAKSPELLRRLAAILSPGVQPSILKLLLEDEADCVKALAAEKLRALDSSA